MSLDLSQLSPGKRKLFELLLKEKKNNSAARLQAIPLRSQSGPLPLSFAQHRIWFVDRLQPGSPTFNISAGVQLKGSLNLVALKQSFVEIVRRHEALRTTFRLEDGNPVQVIEANYHLSPPLVDLSDLPGEERQSRAKLLSDEAALRPIDLREGPMLRLTLLRLEEQEHWITMVIHHIVSDAWSMGVLVQELASLYLAFSSGRQSPLPELSIQYADYAMWQREWLQGETLKTMLDYWKQHLDGKPSALALPLDRSRSTTTTYQSGLQTVDVSRELTQELHALSRSEEATLFMTLLATFKVLLYRYTGQGDLLVGTPMANRERPEIEELIGIFLNTVLLRSKITDGLTFREFLRQIRKVALEAFRHKDLPFERLVEELQPRRDKARTPFVQVWFAMQNTPTTEIKLPGLSISPAPIRNSPGQFDLELLLWDKRDRIEGNFKYNADLFNAATVARMTDLFACLLRHIVGDPGARISTLVGLLNEVEEKQRLMKQQARQEFNRKKFAEIKPKAVRVSQAGLVKTDYLDPANRFPLVIRPSMSGVNLPSWASSNRQFLEDELAKHGAILLRGFNVESAHEFKQIVSAVSPDLVDYYERTVHRTEVADKIYTASEYAPDHPIPFHNEYSFAHVWPMKLWFFCDLPAARGGESTIADCRKVLKLIDPQIGESFETKQVMYVRNYGDGLDLSWQEVFQTDEKSAVEQYCQDARITVEWKDNNRLRTRQVRQAVAAHPKTGEKVWFNQSTLFHVSSLDAATRKSLLTIFSAEENLPRHAFYGDGTPIEESALEQVNQAYQEASVALPLEKGDIVVIDNMLVAHGRTPFVGPRQLLVAMAEPFKNI